MKKLSIGMAALSLAITLCPLQTTAETINAASELTLTACTPKQGEYSGETFPNVQLTFSSTPSEAEGATLSVKKDGKFCGNVGVNMNFIELGASKNVFLITESLINESGVYTIDVPSGFFKDSSGQSNTAFQLKWDYTCTKQSSVVEYRLQLESATYNGVDIMTPDAKFESFGSGQLVVSTTNNEAVKRLSVNLYHRETDEDGVTTKVGDGAWYDITQNSSGVFSKYLGRGVKLLEGITYYIEISGDNGLGMAQAGYQDFGSQTLQIEGTAKPFQYSETTILSITPDPKSYEIEDPDNFYITVSLSGKATVNDAVTFINLGQGMTQKFSKIESESDGSVWKFYVPASYLAKLTATADFSVGFTGEDGRPVKGNNGVEASSCEIIQYECHLSSADVIITPEAGKVKSLFKFRAETDGVTETGDPLSINLGSGVDKPYLTDESGARVAETDMSSEVKFIGEGVPLGPDDFDKCVRYIEFTLNKEITTPGTYVLHCPFAAFALGEEFDGMSSKKMSVTYNIDLNTGVEEFEADGIKVYAEGGYVVLSGLAEGQRVDILGLGGELLASGRAVGEYMRFPIDVKVCVVAIDGKRAVKIAK